MLATSMVSLRQQTNCLLSRFFAVLLVFYFELYFHCTLKIGCAQQKQKFHNVCRHIKQPDAMRTHHLEISTQKFLQPEKISGKVKIWY